MLASEEEGATLDALRFSLASDIVELVVLTADEAFLQTLREAVGGARRVWHVPTAEKVNARYPLILTTGRILSQYNVGAQTRRTENNQWHDEDRLEIRHRDCPPKSMQTATEPIRAPAHDRARP